MVSFCILPAGKLEERGFDACNGHREKVKRSRLGPISASKWVFLRKFSRDYFVGST
jgi:hypothetical protein